MRKLVGRLLLIGLILSVYAQVQTRSVSGYSFQSPQIVESLGSVDSLPSSLQAKDGTIWVAWESIDVPRTDVFFLTMKSDGSGKSPIQNLTGPATSYNRAPSFNQLRNGTIILLWSANQTGYYHIYYKAFNGTVWTKPSQITTGSFDDQVPRTAVAPDSTLWVVWERDTPTGSRQVFYKTLSGNNWSADQELTFDATFNALPNVMVAFDGSIWVSWSKWQSSGQFYNIFSSIFNGTAWSMAAPLTTVNTATFGDTHPDLIQDRNGTIWLFWERELKLSSAIFESKLFYKFSGDAGQTWSPDTQLTFGGDVNSTIDDLEPSTIQGIDRTLWIFYSSDATNAGSLFDIYYIKTNQIWPVHDVAVTSVQVSPVKMYRWNVATITVTVADLGDFPDTVTLSVQAVNKTSFSIGSVSTSLAGGGSKSFIFTWNATGAAPGRYAIVASVAPVLGETVGAQMNNVLRYKSLGILLPGDLNKDYTVNIIDAAIMSVAYGSRPGNTNWNPNADLNRDGVVNIIDFAILGNNYGKSI